MRVFVYPTRSPAPHFLEVDAECETVADVQYLLDLPNRVPVPLGRLQRPKLDLICNERSHAPYNMNLAMGATGVRGYVVLCRADGSDVDEEDVRTTDQAMRMPPQFLWGTTTLWEYCRDAHALLQQTTDIEW